MREECDEVIAHNVTQMLRICVGVEPIGIDVNRHAVLPVRQVGAAGVLSPDLDVVSVHGATISSPGTGATGRHRAGMDLVDAPMNCL